MLNSIHNISVEKDIKLEKNIFHRLKEDLAHPEKFSAYPSSYEISYGVGEAFKIKTDTVIPNSPIIFNVDFELMAILNRATNELSWNTSLEAFRSDFDDSGWDQDYEWSYIPTFKWNESTQSIKVTDSLTTEVDDQNESKTISVHFTFNLSSK